MVRMMVIVGMILMVIRMIMMIVMLMILLGRQWDNDDGGGDHGGGTTMQLVILVVTIVVTEFLALVPLSGPRTGKTKLQTVWNTVSAPGNEHSMQWTKRPKVGTCRIMWPFT